MMPTVEAKINIQLKAEKHYTVGNPTAQKSQCYEKTVKSARTTVDLTI